MTAIAYDNPIPGFQTNNTINLRLWAAKPGQEFDLEAFNTGDYVQVGRTPRGTSLDPKTMSRSCDPGTGMTVQGRVMHAWRSRIEQEANVSGQWCAHFGAGMGRGFHGASML